jgi:hypothetical protein
MAKRRGIKVTPQRRDWDCGIASMAMLLPMEYADVSSMARTLFDSKSLKQNGLLVREMEELAGALGFELKRRHKSKSYLEGQTGILGFNYIGKKGEYGHWAVLKDGTHIVDPDGAEIWSIDDFLKHRKYKTATLLTL